MRNSQISSTDSSKVLLLLPVCVLMSAVLSLCVGAVAVAPGDIAQALFLGKTDTVAAKIILYTRLPRTLAALLSGSALAVAGAVIQTVLCNPLAAPNIIGVNASAGLAVTLACALAPMSAVATPVIAFAGALAGVLLVLALSEMTGASRMTTVLSGVAVSNLFSAAIDAVVTLVPDALSGYSDFRIGGFASVTMTRLAPAAALILVSLALVMTLAQQMDILALGTQTAQSLGLAVRSVRLALLVLAAALCGAAISFAGLLGFVGLIVPHMMRRLVGEESQRLMLACAMGGAALVTLCDTLGRVLFAPYELSVGIVLSFAGVPFFLWLLLKKRGGHTGD
ncbi:MAG: FecCD family ABC transporter permease [Candidatus Ventricola sp.]